MNKLTLFTAISLLFAATISNVTASTNKAAEIRKANDGVVKIISGGRTGTYMRLTDEMKGTLPKYTDDNLRVLPIIGLGSQKNLHDLLYLKGIDIALMQSDVLEAAKFDYPDLKNRVRYITKLHDEEIHILARPEISTIEDLQGKRVSIGNVGSGTAMTAKIIFNTLNLQPQFEYFSAGDALKELAKRRDGIAAFVYVSGKPVELFTKVNRANKFHFINIPVEKLSHIYKATKLTASDYNNLITEDVETVAAQAVMAVYNFSKVTSARYTYVNNFVDALFKSKDHLSQPQHKFHPKWKTIDLCESVPGWTRHDSVNKTYSKYCANSNGLSDSELAGALLNLTPEQREKFKKLSDSEQKSYLELLVKMQK